jgi:hypothetical protein
VSAAPAAPERAELRDAMALVAPTALRTLEQLAAALRYALHIESMLALAALALAVSVIEWVGTLPLGSAALVLPVARALSAAYLYFVVRKAATGSLRLPQLEDHRDVWDATIAPLMQLAVASLWYVGGLLFVAETTVGLEAFAVRHEWRALELFRHPRPAPLLLFGLTVLYLPAAIAAAAVTRQLAGLLDPSRGFRLLFPVARPYVHAFAGLCALTVLCFVADGLGAAFERAVAIPLAAPVMHNVLALWFPLAQARLLGDFLHRHRSALRC